MEPTEHDKVIMLEELGPDTSKRELMNCLEDEAWLARRKRRPESREEWRELALRCIRNVPWAAPSAERYLGIAMARAAMRSEAEESPAQRFVRTAMDTIVTATPPPAALEPGPQPKPESEPRSRGHWRTPVQMETETPDETIWVAWPLAARATTTLLTGDAKTAGKTTLLLAAIARILDGKAWLDRPTVSGPVVYLTEESDEVFLSDLKEAGLLGRTNLYILSHHMSELPWADAIHDARCKAREVGAVGLVVDTFADWTDLDGDAENNSGSIRRIVKPLKAAAAKDKLAVVIVAHERKSGGELGKSVRGSTALPGAVDHIVRQKEDTHSERARKLEMIGRKRTPKVVVVERQPDFSYRLLGTPDDARRDRVEVDARAVMERLLERVPVGEENAISRLELYALRPDGISRDEWRDALRNQRQAGAIRHVSGGTGDRHTRYYRPGSAADLFPSQPIEITEDDELE